MPVFLVTATFDSTTGVPEDAVQNSFHFEAATVNDVSIDGAFDDLETFYNTPPAAQPPGNFVAAWMGKQLSGSATFKAYAVAGAPPHPVLRSRSWTLDNDQTQAVLPSEVAVCLSYRGVLAGGDFDRRRKGRVYIGPLIFNAVDDSPGNLARVEGTFQTVLAQAGADLAVGSGNPAEWVVWSPTYSSSVEVVAGWVDNAFDTQRRRGEATSSRLLWPQGTGALPVRSDRLVGPQLVAVGGPTLVATVPIDETWLVKSASVGNLAVVGSGVVQISHGAAGGPQGALFDQTVPALRFVLLGLWVALDPGQGIFVQNNTGAGCWVALTGARLSGAA